MSLPAQKYSQTKDDKNDQSASEENCLFHETSHSLFCFKRSSLMLSYQQWCLLRPDPPIFLSRLESNFVIKYTPLFYCSVMQILDRKSMFCVTFIEFNSVISYLREYYHFRLSAKIPQETENDIKLSHLLIWLKAKAHQSCEFNNEIILLNVIIFSYTCNVLWNQIYN